MEKLTPPIEALIRKSLEQFASRVPRRLITRNGKIKKGGIHLDGIPYLYRAYLEGENAPEGEPGLVLHKFVASDQPGELHCHPWRWSISFIIAGSYKETRARPIEMIRGVRGVAKDKITLSDKKERTFEPGDNNWISHDDYHRVEILTPEVWTLFLHGPREHGWGFVKEKFGKPMELKKVTVRTFSGRPEVGKNDRRKD